MSRKIPRGKGYDKNSTLRHVKTMTRGGIFVTDYVKQNKLHLDTFMLAVQTHDPSQLGGLPCWPIQNDPKLITETCDYCKDPYWPSRKGSKFCSSYCGSMSRTDEQYFGGKRKNTVGLDEKVCQLCERHVTKGLSSHHMYGKVNDEANEFLLALCSGCHQIVSDLALKTWAADPQKLERLIWLAATQRNGAALLKARREGIGATVLVSWVPAKYDSVDHTSTSG